MITGGGRGYRFKKSATSFSVPPVPMKRWFRFSSDPSWKVSGSIILTSVVEICLSTSSLIPSGEMGEKKGIIRISIEERGVGFCYKSAFY
jgi:hypothetical protein